MNTEQTELEKANEEYIQYAKDVKRLLLAVKRIPELEQQVKNLHQEQGAIRIACQRELDTPIAVDEDVLDLIGKIIDHHKAKEQDLSNLRTDYKKALDALNDEIPSLVCAFVISQHLPPCDSYTNPEENWCGVCKRRRRVNIILSSHSAIAAMKSEVWVIRQLCCL